MKKSQKVLSIILSVVLILSLCVTMPVTVSAKRPSASYILYSIISNGPKNPVPVISLLSNIIPITLTIDGLYVPPDFVDIIDQVLEEAKPIINGEDVTKLQIQTSLIRLTNVYNALAQCVNERPTDELPPQTLLIMCEAYRTALSNGMSGAMTADEIALLEDAMTNAEAIANDPSATQTDIERSMEELIALFKLGEDPTDPTQAPTEKPTTADPTQAPTEEPTTADPTQAPTKAPASDPTNAPIPSPTSAPTNTGNGKGDIPTGDSSAAVVMTLSLIMLAAAFVAASKRKKETM